MIPKSVVFYIPPKKHEYMLKVVEMGYYNNLEDMLSLAIDLVIRHTNNRIITICRMSQIILNVCGIR